jgi:squalene-associated FAD-dependent desaturase
MARVIVIGGGLAGIAATAALAGAGYHVDLFESRGFLGGRATSYPLSPADEDSEQIDNCQHVLMGCFVNLLDLYRRLGVDGLIRFHREFYFLEPGGRVSVLRSGRLPAPAHFASSFLKLKFLGTADKFAVVRGLAAILRESGRGDLGWISMLDWLREKRQTPVAIERFWRQVLVSSINEELDQMAAAQGFQVFRDGFLAGPAACRMGVSDVPLNRLYRADALRESGRVALHLRTPVQRVCVEGGAVRGVVVNGELRPADYYISCVPFERTAPLVPELGIAADLFAHSPITGIHLWFDRPVMDLPHATLLDRTMQWAFNKAEGRYIQLVVSASRSLVEMGRADVIALAVKELGEFLPAVRGAGLEKAHVVKEVRATFSARPGTSGLRPPQETAIPNLFLAGDWTCTGWPATMEGAVRSGYLAAEAVARAAGEARRFLV